ncbi:hypothetical protein [Collimonas humicola]|uniref:hypothetical protein n=1 Tax=Collimonas humicola TaxID=2825886 RepID=UPI001B8D277B|nr:hypothetical protein [Collimonas humicola]
MSWYKAGKIAVTNGSKAITGNGTDFVINVKPGFAFLGPDFQLYEVDAVVSATSATLATAYRGVTAAAADYGIFQTQGIIADLSAQVAALINNYGGIAQQFPDALNVISAAQNSANAAQATAGAKYGKANILGVVGQTGGVPTGAIIESGSNANGYYTKWANGTQHCWSSVLFPRIDVGTSGNVVWTFPAAFVTGPGVSNSIVGQEGSGDQSSVGVLSSNGLYMAIGNASVTFLSYAYKASMTGSVRLSVMATGRWF